MSLRWRKNKRLTGLAGVAATGALGSTLNDGDVKFASINELRNGQGWYYVVGWNSGLPYINTCNDPVPDEATAKSEAMAYVRENMKTKGGAA